ncbi:hypothetical protein EJ03DRAFT_135033 [Teratosphaeria nubilosa]|uniref:INO80 complex subunit F domain-containing protein n=1 Tax=Teratosphaeria nubilosa TaxID=161662 RepID=A0A6G1L530_9PEZI|nr:hypothetical protein EJ03DRAFT_135033 [Teratosphaeria nubilosa]
MPSDLATANTPLAPSVEKAYYRKCIQLKRRLNEVEAANDEAKLRRTRLERGIMKMRLERAFLLKEMEKRVNAPVGDPDLDTEPEDGVGSPPPRERGRGGRRTAPRPSTQSQDPPMVEFGGQMYQANVRADDGSYAYLPPDALEQLKKVQAAQPAPSYPPLPHSSPYGAPVGVPGATAARGDAGEIHDGDDVRTTNRASGAVGEAVGGANGEVPGSAAQSIPEPAVAAGGGGGGFAAINR